LGGGQQVQTSATNEREVLKYTQELNESNVTIDANPIEIVAQDRMYSVAFLVDGEHVVSGGREKKIRQWQVEDGKEVGKPIDAGSDILDLAVTQDGKWIVCGTRSGKVIVWSAKTDAKVVEFKAHDESVNAVDVSADGTKIATG
jgi:WD40 repeat protein